MSSICLTSGRQIGDYILPYFVAEINTSHFGKIETAIQMVDEAKRIGVDCVKFQSWSEESLYSESYYKTNPIAKRFIKKFSLNDIELLEIARHCRQIEIGFASTPYSITEVDFLADVCQVPFLKVASMDLNNIPFLKYIAEKQLPVFLSTGMGTLDEISMAVSTIEKSGNFQIVILHCVSLYPTASVNVRLMNIIGLRKLFPMYPIGFSDHSTSIGIPAASVALGAAVIEKHFTLDRSIIGMDNQMAIESGELESIIQACKEVNAALGDEDRMLSDGEFAQRKLMRRSAVAGRKLESGHVLDRSDFNFKRPGTGIAPDLMETLLGRVLLRDVEYDDQIIETDVS